MRPEGRPPSPAVQGRLGSVADVLVGEAQAILDVAASEQDVEGARLVAFARACLQLSETGRLALAVLDGGLFAPTRALELAARVLRESEEAPLGSRVREGG
ncbi:MAG TPA: hypothetical protein VJV79_19690 [Polyangiaceae bacterium]|nr:hypothetical protein [Polyangiaceae bacterium]